MLRLPRISAESSVTRRRDVVEIDERRELPAELEQRRRALGLAPRRLVEARVLDGDRRVAREHLQQPHVVLVELVQPELGDDDHADDATAVAKRHRKERLLDRVGALDQLPELAVRGVGDDDRLAALGAATGDTFPDAFAEDVERVGVHARGEIAEEGDRDELVAVDDEDAAVVVVDERPELRGDRVADLAHVVEPVQPPGQALQHLQVRDGAHVPLDPRRIGPPRPVLVVEDDLVLALRLRRHHRGLRAGRELAWVHGVLGPEGEPDRDGHPADPREVDLRQPALYPLGHAHRVLASAPVHDDRELLAAEPADHVVRPDDRAQALGEEAQQLVADGVAVHVVDVLEVVDVQHEHRQRRVRAARLLQRLQQPLVEDAVVEEAGERVGACLMLETLSDLGVVERERGRVAEALRDLELRLAERDAVALAVDVQRALDLAARDERDADEGFGLHRGSGHGANARVEVRLVAQHSLAMARCPPGDALREADRRAHDLVGVHVPHEHRLEHALRLVGLVDRQRVERRNQVADGVGDAHQERVEALLGEDLVEDVREPPVRLDEGRIAPRRVVVEQPEMAGPDYHRSPNRSQF